MQSPSRDFQTLQKPEGYVNPWKQRHVVAANEQWDDTKSRTNMQWHRKESASSCDENSECRKREEFLRKELLKLEDAYKTLESEFNLYKVRVTYLLHVLHVGCLYFCHVCITVLLTTVSQLKVVNQTSYKH